MLNPSPRSDLQMTSGAVTAKVFTKDFWGRGRVGRGTGRQQCAAVSGNLISR